METMLAENIRKFRKERSLTQEQLSEVLGVTAGAVYKWEAKLSVPELDLIVEMADFFDTSVDVLLGYEIKDNRLPQTVQRLKDIRRRKDRSGLTDAEKALKKYPHVFSVVHECAVLYSCFGIEGGNKDLCRRALDLLEEARLLLGQNTDPEISEQTLYNETAEMYLVLDETEKAIDLWKQHNAGGVFNDRIGLALANTAQAEDAFPFLSASILTHVSAVVRTVLGYVNVYGAKGDRASAQAILLWCIGVISGLKDGNKPNFFDKIHAVALACLAWTQLGDGQTDAARASLESALALAERFDAAPSYEAGDVRFISSGTANTAYDDLGATAAEGLENAVRSLESDELAALWAQVKDQKEKKP